MPCSIITVPRGHGNTFQRAAAYNKPGWVMHMDNNEIMKSLEDFDEVWKRVTAARPEAAKPPMRSGGAAELMPGKKPQSRAVRFCPPHK